MIDNGYIENILKQNGYSVASVGAINGGSNHYVFDVRFTDGSSAIAKLPRVRVTEERFASAHLDTLFGGRLSIERERFIFDLVREQGQLPAPRVFGCIDTDGGKMLLIEKMSGFGVPAFMRIKGHSRESFLSVIRNLARDYAKLHKNIRYEAFGDIQPEGLEPVGLTNFADRFLPITNMRIDKAVVKGMFTPVEENGVHTFFKARFEQYRDDLQIANCGSTINFTDMHGDNFYVSDEGVPTGYFDLESSQAAPAWLDYYSFRFFLFNFYDEDTFNRANDAFFEAYIRNGGVFYPKTERDNEIIDFLAACRLLEISQSYWAYVDGLRDTWGERIKALLFRYMNTGRVDYTALAAIFRERDGQPEHPNQ